MKGPSHSSKNGPDGGAAIHPPAPGYPADPALRDALQLQIESLVQALRHAETAVPGVFRSFCKLARGWGGSPEEFRSRMVRAGLEASRASEIKTVLSVAEWRDDFIAGTTSWKQALTAARSARFAAQGLDPLRRAAANLVALMHRNGIDQIQHPLGTITLRVRHGCIGDFRPPSADPLPASSP